MGAAIGIFLEGLLGVSKENEDDTLHYLHRLLLEAQDQIEKDCWRGLLSSRRNIMGDTAMTCAGHKAVPSKAGE